MAISGKHIILRKIVDCEYNGVTDGFALQRQVTEWCHRELIPRLDEQLRRLHTKGKVYRIDKLEINVQVDASANWMTIAAEQIVKQVQDKIEGAIQQLQADPSVQLKTYPQLFVDAFIYFLQHGSLPWWSPVTSYHLWHEELDNLLITGFNEAARNRLVQLIKQPAVQQRIIYQLPDELFIKLMVQVNSEVEKDITNLINDIKHLVTDAGERKTVLGIFRQSVMSCIYDVNAIVFAEQVYAHFVQQLSATGRLHPLLTNKNSFGNTKFRKAHEQRPASRAEKQKQSVTENKAAKEEEGLYINNAGLVIVAPFLPTLFKKWHLYNETALTDVNKSVCLVQYLASGREVVAEFELGLAKILCGLQPDTPVDTGIRFTSEEKEEVNDLLASAIEYWQILKDTSPEGLRQSFLQRQGKLQLVKNNWQLQVEQKPWDVLLQHLPWNISMLKLPWMTKMLKTDW